MSNNFEIATGVAKRDLRGLNYVFIAVDGLKRDIFLPATLPGNCGFEIVGITEGVEIELEYITLKNGNLRATWIRRVSEQLASVKKAAPRAKKAAAQPKVSKPKQAKKPTAAGPRPWTRQIVDRNGGRVLVKHQSPTGRIVQYSVEDNDGNTLVKQRNMTLVEGRELIGKVIAHPTAAGHGVKTNDPKISRDMKDGGSKNKKAA